MTMNTIRALTLATLAMFAMLQLSETSAYAADTHYIAGMIRNDLPVRINYQYKLNNGNWVTLSLAPGQTQNFSLPYGQAAINSTIYIRYDGVPNDGAATTLHTTTLLMHGTKNPSEGRLQVFIVTNSGRNIHLAR
jgi:hypothetical protein